MIEILEKPEIRRQAAGLTIEAYHKLVEKGLIQNNLELLNGVLFEKMSKSPLHRYLVRVIYNFLQKNLDSSYLIFHEEPLTIRGSEPEPDISILKGNEIDFITRHPATALLVIEVSVSSTTMDIEKADIYAEAEIPEYIIIDADEKKMIRFTNPTEKKYLTKQSYNFTDMISLKKFPQISFSLSQFWPNENSDYSDKDKN